MEIRNAVSELLDLLNKAIARELQVSIQYMFQHSIGTDKKFAVPGKTPSASRFKFVASRSPYWLPGASLKKIAIAERVVRLGGEPTTQPEPITLGETIQAMLEHDLEQERGAIQLYGQIIDLAEQNADDDVKRLFERILADEEKHHQTFADLLAED